jgi:ElaA protein
MEYSIKSFDELTPLELYQILKLREEVFIVEQNCVYKDIDDYDLRAYHLMGKINNEIQAYARIFSPRIKYPECSIGRVVVRKEQRLNFYGKSLMQVAIKFLNEKFSGVSIVISAQLYLKKFYEEFGFKAIYDVYDEDGIPHIKMILDA